MVFNDSHYGKDHPEDCIESTVSQRLWPSAFSRNAWEYNVELAKEAIEIMGFNEIQFDYVRFPDRTINLEKNGTINLHNDYQEEKSQAIQNFIIYALTITEMPLGMMVTEASSPLMAFAFAIASSREDA